MNYKIVRTRAGKISVKYECPHCNEALESQLAEAGQKDSCPACKGSFTVPGQVERAQLEEKLRKELQERKAKEDDRLIKQAQLSEAKNVRSDRMPPDPKAPEITVKRETPVDSRFSTHQSIRYPTLEFYIRWMRITGLLCFIAAWITLPISLLVFVKEVLDVDGNLAGAVGLFSFSLAAFSAGISCRFAAELVLLALDVRTDIARLVSLNNQVQNTQ